MNASRRVRRVRISCLWQYISRQRELPLSWLLKSILSTYVFKNSAINCSILFYSIYLSLCTHTADPNSPNLFLRSTLYLRSLFRKAIYTFVLIFFPMVITYMPFWYSLPEFSACVHCISVRDIRTTSDIQYNGGCFKARDYIMNKIITWMII